MVSAADIFLIWRNSDLGVAARSATFTALEGFSPATAANSGRFHGQPIA